MKSFFRKFEEPLLVVLAFVLVGLIIAYFVWGIGYVFSEANSALNANGTASQGTGFNLEGAQLLHLRGLVSQ
ncbi:MAG TPA: hypothetical protein VHZ04_03345 [Candidatus Paceibacterota bacterium]|jgi:hypothetical protein|nr:hypothetical protein [Candidatus Paceibacterota bacterium]